ncbi:MAG: nitroreductase [Nitrosopumilus sp.]|nr:nitroreductase [Nitrosopumilus sp.]
MDSENKEEKIYPLGYEPKITPKSEDPTVRNQLLDFILKSGPTEVIDTDLFAVMSKRRSTRKFSDKPVETTKIDKIIAAADTAPTAGNFQGFEIFYVKSPEKKKLLVDACNKQPYVNAPVVLAFCKNPSRVKFDFPDYVLKKFAIQDATLAAGYSQLAAQALGLSSIWIGMFDEQKVMDVLGTDLVPSSLLCIGYPEQTKFPKPRRNLKDLVHVTW